MEKEELLDYEEREKEEGRKLLDKSVNAKHFSISDFYPSFHLSSDDSPYCGDLTKHETLGWNTPLWILLPFYKKIIVGIEPLRDKEAFEDRYGVSLRHFLGLIKDGHIIVRLNNPPMSYEGLHYLDDILEARPPSSLRSDAFSVRCVGSEEDFMSCVDDAEGFLRNLAWSGKYWKKPKAQSARALANLHTRLMIHEPEIIDYIKNEAKKSGILDADIVRLYVSYYYSLVAPTYRSFDGCHALPKEVFGKVVQKTGTIFAFPMEIGRFLTTKFELYCPNSLDDAVSIYPDYQKARDVLKRLDQMIDGKDNEDKIVDTTEELKHTWSEVANIERAKEMVGKISSYLGVVGPLASSLATVFPPMLALLGFTVLDLPDVKEVLSENIAKLGKPSHIVTVYDFQKDVEKWKKGRS